MTSPIEIEKELSRLGEEVERWALLSAWHEAQRDWRKTRLTVAEARAVLSYAGPVGKAKYEGIVATERQRVELDIANAQLALCSKRLYALDKLIFTTLGRNKSVGHHYNSGAY